LSSPTSPAGRRSGSTFPGPPQSSTAPIFRAQRFAEPFFDQTVARWASGPRARQLVRTGLEALVALDSQPSLEPAGMIFQYPAGRVFAGDERERRPVTDAMREAVQRFAAPGYRALASH
jgi:hypothetical protein